MKTEGSDNGLPSSSRVPWKTVRMMFYLKKHCKPLIAQQISKIKNCLYAFSIFSSGRVPVQPVSKLQQWKERGDMLFRYNLTALLCRYSYIHILETAQGPVRNHSPSCTKPVYNWDFLPSPLTSRLSLFR